MRIKLRYKITMLRSNIAFGLIRLASKSSSRATELFAFHYCEENLDLFHVFLWDKARSQ